MIDPWYLSSCEMWLDSEINEVWREKVIDEGERMRKKERGMFFFFVNKGRKVIKVIIDKKN